MPSSVLDQQPFTTKRPTAALPQGTSEKLFSVQGGKIRLLGIVGEVTTVLPGTANATKLVFQSAVPGSTTDLCSTLDITGSAAGSLFSITGTLATALKITSANLAVPADDVPWPGLVLGIGDILLSCVGSMASGAVKWTALWGPLDDVGNLVAVPK